MFLLVKYALVDFSPVGVAFMQSLVGALGLFAIVVVEGGEARAALGDILRRPAQALVLGALAIAAPFMLIALGELSVPSGLAGTRRPEARNRHAGPSSLRSTPTGSSGQMCPCSVRSPTAGTLSGTPPPVAGAR